MGQDEGSEREGGDRCREGREALKRWRAAHIQTHNSARLVGVCPLNERLLVRSENAARTN